MWEFLIWFSVGNLNPDFTLIVAKLNCIVNNVVKDAFVNAPSETKARALIHSWKHLQFQLNLSVCDHFAEWKQKLFNFVFEWLLTKFVVIRLLALQFHVVKLTYSKKLKQLAVWPDNNLRVTEPFYRFFVYFPSVLLFLFFLLNHSQRFWL